MGQVGQNPNLNPMMKSMTPPMVQQAKEFIPQQYVNKGLPGQPPSAAVNLN